MKIGMNTWRKEIRAAETNFDVVYYASKGWPGSYWEPPEPAELNIEQVFIGSEEVTDLLAEWVSEAIYEALEKSLNDEAKQADEDRAEAEYEAWKERESYIEDMIRSAK